MAEEPAAAAASPSPADLKRKHPESELAEHVTVLKEEEQNEDAKRPRFDLDEKNIYSLVSENGSQEDKLTEPAKEEEEPSEENNTETETPQQTADEASEATEQTTKEAPEGVDNEKPSSDDQQVGDIPVGENPQSENENQQPTETEVTEPSVEATPQVDGPSGGDPPASETEGMSRKMDVPNDKVGVLIGKGGETIRYLQINSGAKIQIMRDADVDPHSTNRPVELIGGLENINKAEKLIKDVIAEADAGGSPALVARGFSTAQAAGAVEQVLIQVPNEKVGVIIGKGGDTIKNLQTRSGARIQLIPQHLPDGDQSKERTVRVSGDKKQIERAREMIKEVMSQPPRQSSSGGYNQQQSFRPRGPSSQQQWGSRGPNASHPSGYDYPQRGPYPSQNSQYQPHGYNNYPHQSGPRSSYGPAWGDQRPPTMQGRPHQGGGGGGGGYDYYNAPSSGPHSNPHQAHGPGPTHSNMGPPSQGSYNYNQPGTYPHSQGYGYAENKYENQAPAHPQQQPYGKAPPPYGVPPQNYGQPRASQPTDMPPQQAYGQNTVPPQQPYGQNTVPPQQSYPQNYPSYGPAEGYNQPQPAPGSAPMYPQQSGQQGTGYGQVAGYGSYPAQQGYVGDQSSAQNNVGYGYQAGADPAYGGGGAAAYGGPPAGQVGYAQPVPAQQGYDQSAPNPGGYVGVPAAGYGKGVSPQAGYDATQMYGAAPAPAPAPR